MKLYDIHIRDPFILAEDGKYYLYGTRGADTWGDGTGFDVYISEDLENFSDPIECFTPPADFWSSRNFWAPEVHRYEGNYYMLASFISNTRKRGTQILISESPLGPFRPHSDGPVTPAAWNCLDGTLYIENGEPYMIYCREWNQPDGEIIGEMHAIKLSHDLKKAIGEPIFLFKASEPAWVPPESRRRFVTDGPFVHRMESGKILLLLSSFGTNGYLEAISYPENGKLTDRWIHEKTPLFSRDGGHGMVFRTFEGQLMFTYHTPNNTPFERPAFLPLEEKDGALVPKE